MNWQNVNADPTWTSVDNWYWRSWEVCIGLVASCIPALRPAYRLVSSSVKSYLSHRSFRKSSAEILVEPSEAAPSFVKRLFNRGHASHDPALEAAAYTASVEAEHTQAYGAGEDGFAMKNLPGDREVSHGIQKTTTIDIEDGAVQGSQRGFASADRESGERSKWFV